MSAIEALKGRLRSGDGNLLKLHRGDAPPLSEIRESLGRFQGGSVDIVFHHDENIAVVSLNHPEKKNAISGKMMGDFLDVVEKLETWKEGKGVILRGSNGNFCSGGDLALARGTGDADGAMQMAVFMDHILARFQTLPFITVAVIEGCGALGGGSEVSVACDYRLIAPTSQGIGFVHGRMAIVPAWGSTKRLVGLLGYRGALEVLSTAKVYTPAAALQMGLVDEMTDEKDPAEYALKWLRERTRLTASVTHAIKTTALIACHDPDVADLERRIFAPFWGSEDNKAALAANIKHRPR